MKKYLAFLMAAAILLQTVPVCAAAPITSFTDYDKDLGFGQLSTHWAKNSIEILLAHDGIHGYPEGDFRANREISAAELIAILLNTSARAEGLTGETWEEKIMHRAYELGICEEAQLPLAEANQPISREKMALVLVNCASIFFGMDTTRAILVSPDSIADLRAADPAYQDAILQAYTLGLTAGTGIYFAPNSSTTRAEAAAVVNRLMGYEKAIDSYAAEKRRLAEIEKQAAL